MSNRKVLIGGPTANTTFYIYDSKSNVWDGKRWIGFGRPKEYKTFQLAIKSLPKATQ